MVRKMKATAVEAKGNELRTESRLTPDTEKVSVQVAMDIAKMNKIGGKMFMYINPLFVHIPDWQRDVTTTISLSIANGYVEEKWDIPKVIYINDRLEVIDGSHRIFGAQLGHISSVLVNLMEISEREAIKLFISQSSDRHRMLPIDYYIPGLKLKDPTYITLRDICHQYNVSVYDGELKDSVGTLHGISTCVRMIQKNPSMLDLILSTIINLGWAGSNHDAFKCDVIRTLQKIFAERKDNIELIQGVLYKRCSGADFYDTKVRRCGCQSKMYDMFMEIIRDELHIEVINKIA